MSKLTFNIPTYPQLGRFSDPNQDFGELRDELERLAALPAETLSAEEICLIFNSWLPAGSFEEMVPYVPHALDLLQSPTPDDWSGEIAHVLLDWCYVEEASITQDPALLKGLQEAFQLLFSRWTSTLAWTPREGGGYIVSYADHIENLLKWGLFAAERSHNVIPWLQPQHYLEQLYTLGSIEHAVLSLWVSDQEENILPAPLRIAGEKRRMAVNMVAEWLHESASPEQCAIWRSTLEHHQQELARVGDSCRSRRFCS